MAQNTRIITEVCIVELPLKECNMAVVCGDHHFRSHNVIAGRPVLYVNIRNPFMGLRCSSCAVFRLFDNRISGRVLYIPCITKGSYRCEALTEVDRVAFDMLLSVAVRRLFNKNRIEVVRL